MIAEYGASASDVKAEFIWAVPPAANDNSPFGGGDHIAGYAPLALVTPNAQAQLELYWVHGNHLGVPIVTTDAQGSIVDPGSDFLRPGFPGQSQVLSDLYYNRNRDYDPVTGRYIQADPIGLAGGSNLYLYANVNPVNLIDPTGQAFFLAAPIVGAIGGGLSDVGIQAFSLWRRGCDVFDHSNYNWSDVAVSAAFGAAVPGPLSAIKNTYSRYKKLRGAPRKLNRQPYAAADSATAGDVLRQLARGAAAAGVKNLADGFFD